MNSESQAWKGLRAEHSRQRSQKAQTDEKAGQGSTNSDRPRANGQTLRSMTGGLQAEAWPGAFVKGLTLAIAQKAGDMAHKTDRATGTLLEMMHRDQVQVFTYNWQPQTINTRLFKTSSTTHYGLFYWVCLTDCSCVIPQ